MCAHQILSLDRTYREPRSLRRSAAEIRPIPRSANYGRRNVAAENIQFRPIGGQKAAFRGGAAVGKIEQLVPRRGRRTCKN